MTNMSVYLNVWAISAYICFILYISIILQEINTVHDGENKGGSSTGSESH